MSLPCRATLKTEGGAEPVEVLEILGDLARVRDKACREWWVALGRLTLPGVARRRREQDRASPTLF